MTRNMTLVLGGLACIALGAVGYWMYQDQHRNAVQLDIGGRSITVQTR